MATKSFLVICAAALLVKVISAYPGCGCGMNSASLAGAIAGADIAAAEIAGVELAAANFRNLGYGAPAYTSAPIYANPAFATSNGGTFSVSMSSPIYPTGITILSENSIDGTLEVVGSLPLLATVALDGVVPSSGAAGASQSCGSGYVGITSESLAAAGLSNGFDAGLAGAAIAGAELAGINAGYGAEIAGINAGFMAPAGYSAAMSGAEPAGFNPGFAGAGFAAPGCGYY